MKKLNYFFLFVSIFLVTVNLFAEEFILSGSQESVINYTLKQRIEPFPGIELLIVCFVVPADYSSPTFNQKVSDLNFDFSVKPQKEERDIDERGNIIRQFYWNNPSESILCSVSLKAENQVKLVPIECNAAFPPKDLPQEVKDYLHSTDQVQSDNTAILTKAKELTDSSLDQYEAVQSILHYTVDNMRYVLVPEQYDALYSFNTGKGNCQNYSHLAAALMRAVDIPVRIVNGISLKKAYEIESGDARYSFEMAQGRHSWIEVFFEDIGWIPFDPQQTQFFIHNRYLRIETGIDNDETGNDGMVRWSQSKGSKPSTPGVMVTFDVEFCEDKVALKIESIKDRPKKLLLTPKLIAAVSPTIIEEPIPPIPIVEEPIPVEPAPPEPEAAIDYSKLTFNLPFEYGNLEFPQRFNFLFASVWGSEESAIKGEIKRNFIVETAEYATGNQNFSQTFILYEPVILSEVSLALLNFGGDGELWLELCEDNGGIPGEPVSESKRIPTRDIFAIGGYDWVDFDFSDAGTGLSPGRYWFTLRYSGSPIINWFYTYGKPVGPTDGTRSSSINDNNWEKVFSYEFNYRIIGKSAEDWN
ncbi:MAG: transglutaminase domain-containing protein [candidate division Zixibacteria bacterium]|nr:transglutaminase domain-containing protein [Candidatus Tariuqbacter arcticus]